ncbi:hypothetical protein QTV49_004618 [Vibrio vulnificus]|nr:hypothetical protein [Vibrio vulnificus]
MNKYIECYYNSLKSGDLEELKKTNIAKCANLIQLIISNLEYAEKVSEPYVSAQSFMDDLIELEGFFNRHDRILKYQFLIEERLSFEILAVSGTEDCLNEIHTLALLFDKDSNPDSTIYHLRKLCEPFIEYHSQTKKVWQRFRID